MNKFQTINGLLKNIMNLLRKLPTDVIDIIYSFDDNKKNRQNKNIYVMEIKERFRHYKKNYEQCVLLLGFYIELYEIYAASMKSKKRDKIMSVSTYLLKRNEYDYNERLTNRNVLKLYG